MVRHGLYYETAIIFLYFYNEPNIPITNVTISRTMPAIVADLSNSLLSIVTALSF